jgi:predicted transcriptional regulator of viral defense system
MYPAGITKRNREYLERLHRQESAAFDVDTAARALELDRDTTARLLGYLARRGWLSRVRRGLYVAVPLDARRSGEWIEDSWIVADQVFSPCYIGGWSACEHWDLTEQVFRTLLVVTARQVHDRDVTLQGIPIRLTVRPREKHFGTVPVWRAQKRVAVSDPTRTVVDVLDDPRLGGGIRTVADIIHAYMASGHRNDRLIVQYGDQLGNRSVFKRLGYLLEQAGTDARDLLTACLERRSTGLTSLDPSVRAPGRIMRRWGLRINVTMRPEG